MELEAKAEHRCTPTLTGEGSYSSSVELTPHTLIQCGILGNQFSACSFLVNKFLFSSHTTNISGHV